VPRPKDAASLEFERGHTVGRVEGKVAFITGAARGQGRAEARRLAEEGADIIAVDICRDIPSIPYPLASKEDLDETVRLVRESGRRAVGVQADVRELGHLRGVLTDAVAELGRLDVVVAQAGIAPFGADQSAVAFADVIDVNLAGVTNTVSAALPHLTAGASIIATGSLAGFVASRTNGPGSGGGAGQIGYMFAKLSVANFVHELAYALAPLSIRANAIHPGNTDTDMLHGIRRAIRPDLEAPTRADLEDATRSMHGMPVAFVEPSDIAEAVVYLASDESRYVSGTQFHVDAGGFPKWSEFRR
jgi:SDR family mycofactocin-dependent oxidoreductase